MEIRFDAMLYSNSGNVNSDTGHDKYLRGSQVPVGGFDNDGISDARAGPKPMQPMHLHWAPHLCGPRAVVFCQDFHFC